MELSRVEINHFRRGETEFEARVALQAHGVIEGIACKGRRHVEIVTRPTRYDIDNLVTALLELVDLPVVASTAQLRVLSLGKQRVVL